MIKFMAYSSLSRKVLALAGAVPAHGLNAVLQPGIRFIHLALTDDLTIAGL